MRDWYQDICIEFENGEETMIEEHNDEHYHLYKKLAEDMGCYDYSDPWVEPDYPEMDYDY